MQKKGFVLWILLTLCGLQVTATHQRAGEITYTHLSGLTYEFKLITYTYTPSPADRPELEIFWGDGSSSIVARTSKVSVGNDISLNTYITQHTFPAAGYYSITMEDPDRNAGIVNIPNSVEIPFFLETTLLINPFLGANSSPQLLNPPIDNGCVNKIYYHNPGAYDTDGDSLSYELVICRGYNGEEIPGYTMPYASNGISIDPVTGDLVWDSPATQGEYNIAILIKEWRNGICIGSVVRDMQITIATCNNEPPVIETINDTCVLAGTTLEFYVSASDVNSSQVTLSATGGPFQVAHSPAVFPPQTGEPTLTTPFIWHTQCEHVKRNAYQVSFKAIDNGPQVNLVAFKTLYIKIIADKTENLSAHPVGNEVQLDWSPHTCTNVKGYKIYKRISSYPFEPDYCQTGLPEEAGYQLIGTTNERLDTTFTDNGQVMPLQHGTEYCYRIVAFFADGAESYVSDEVCLSLVNDAPLITHVDVEETDATNGRIRVQWMQPMELDLDAHAQFRYIIKRANYNAPDQYVALDTLHALNDTVYFDNHLNTKDLRYFYKIELEGSVFGNFEHIETSDAASSVFLSFEPLDRALRLQWVESVPWHNEVYTIYRYDENLAQFDSIGISTEQTFVDAPLQNGKAYCYYVESAGRYNFTDSLHPYLNRSQQNCAVPADVLPPETPTATITTDCENVFFSWHFSSDTAYEDVDYYLIYYKPTLQSDFMLLDSIANDGNSCYTTDCHYTLPSQSFITGCFVLSARDTAFNQSAFDDKTCFDVEDCMPYQLPNVFTPDGDGSNDLFQPFPYANVEKVDFTVYDRWGRRMFHTTDPDLNWDGRNQNTKRLCSNGIYYYVCDVTLHTLAGLVTKPLHGSITLITKKN